MKVKNVGKHGYIGPGVQVAAGEVAEVTDAQGAYLIGADCPGSFEVVKEEAPAKKPGKDKA